MKQKLFLYCKEETARHKEWLKLDAISADGRYCDLFNVIEQ